MRGLQEYIFFFIGACLFQVSLNIFVKLVRLVNSRVIFSLLSKEFKSIEINRLKRFYNFFVIIFDGDFGKVDLRSVTTSLWKSDNPVSNTWVSWKLLIVLVRNKSMQGLFGFLKHALGKVLSFFCSIYYKMYLALYHLLAH